MGGCNVYSNTSNLCVVMENPDYKNMTVRTETVSRVNKWISII